MVDSLWLSVTQRIPDDRRCSGVSVRRDYAWARRQPRGVHIGVYTFAFAY